MGYRFHLVGDFGELLRIEDNDYFTNYFILSEDGECLQRVNADKFKKEFLLYEDLRNNTWDKEFKKQYDVIKNYLKGVNYENNWRSKSI